MRARSVAALAAALFPGLHGALAADLPGDPIIGGEIAEEWCGACHDVAPGGIVMYDGAPPLQMVADDPAFTEMALRAFLQTAHADMPDVMPDRAETDHIVAYILSLRRE